MRWAAARRARYFAWAQGSQVVRLRACASMSPWGLVMIAPTGTSPSAAGKRLLQGELLVVEVAGCVGWRWLGWHGLLLGLARGLLPFCWLIARFAACFLLELLGRLQGFAHVLAALAGAGWVG